MIAKFHKYFPIGKRKNNQPLSHVYKPQLQVKNKQYIHHHHHYMAVAVPKPIKDNFDEKAKPLHDLEEEDPSSAYIELGKGRN